MKQSIVAVTSVEAMLAAVRELEGPPEQWIFRGTPDEKHLLLPSIGRIRQASVSQCISRDEEALAMSRFRDAVRPLITLQLENELEWLVLAQHHGMPTRLLDWTRSPLVALYFASKSIEARLTIVPGQEPAWADIDGKVDIVRRPAPSLGHEDAPFHAEEVLAVDPPHISNRIPLQQSELTLHPDPAEPWNPIGARRLIIPRSAKFEIKLQLDRLGLNEASLFPGVDAVARNLGWQLKWNRLRGA